MFFGVLKVLTATDRFVTKGGYLAFNFHLAKGGNL